jgi:hypothetical protein
VKRKPWTQVPISRPQIAWDVHPQLLKPAWPFRNHERIGPFLGVRNASDQAILWGHTGVLSGLL